MLAFDPTVAAQYGGFVEYAYLMYAQNPGNLTPPPPADFATVTGCEIVAYLTCVDTFLDKSTTTFYGFIARSTGAPAQLVIAIRGTLDYTEWFDDFEVWPQPFTPIPAAGWVEHGFFEIFQSMRAVDLHQQVLDPYALLATLAHRPDAPSITVVGHSLGGAIATLVALVAGAQDPALSPRLTLYTLASPALGDRTFARYFDAHVPSSFRVWNAADIVPRALLYIYTPVDGAGQEIIETPEQAAQVRATWACAHSLLTYLWLLDPNNHFAPMFKASACHVGKPEAAAARQALRIQQLAQPTP